MPLISYMSFLSQSGDSVEMNLDKLPWPGGQLIFYFFIKYIHFYTSLSNRFRAFCLAKVLRQSFVGLWVAGLWTWACVCVCVCVCECVSVCVCVFIAV